MTAELSERNITISNYARFVEGIPEAEQLNPEEDVFESYQISKENVFRLGGFALADGQRPAGFIVDSAGTAEAKIETYSRRTPAYDRELTEEEAERYSCRKHINAEPGVKPQGVLGEINPIIR